MKIERKSDRVIIKECEDFSLLHTFDCGQCFRFTEREDKSFSVAEINDVIKCSLDALCEKIDGFFAERYKDEAATALAASPICRQISNGPPLQIATIM